ncbi:hypothetical protein BDB00DRAFT_129765 [Zychaea mexicana]|uniref:uncharacterized protein n=1 Tax=Zychaea mexicana TaxID=64656 RepID=UPI0022FE615F|nr:uncharacterized protein BDB00DRAFT_129765 [Zychaea mexicana]KAI9484557.1 hypothetical protein BDB00DRAFT_129765 [Zychaea mexicana]
MTELCHGKPIVRLPKKRGSMMTTDRIAMTTKQGQQPPPLREALVSDRLYTEGIPSTVSENDIMDLVQSCDPVEVRLNRLDGTGYIQFPSIDKADRAYTLFNDATLKNQVSFQLKIAPPGDYQEPEATSGIYQIRNLPLGTTNLLLYEFFRPFGPMNLCKIIMDQGKGFKGTALVQYFDANDAEMAVKTMNNKNIQGHTINVFPFVSKKGRPHSSEVMTLLHQQPLQQQPLAPSPTKALNGSSNGSGTGGNNGSTVDYTNLYIKNLDLQVRSCDLFKHFRQYGHIISARVMRNPETDQSKGFGFVSFGRAEEAQRAREEMNNKYILSKPIIVAFHEPKKPRTEKNGRSHDMVRRFSTPGIPAHPPPPYVPVAPTIPEYIDYSKPSPQPGAAPPPPLAPSSRRPLTTTTTHVNAVVTEKFPGIKKRHSTMTHIPPVSAAVTPTAAVHTSSLFAQHPQPHYTNNHYQQQHHHHHHNPHQHPFQKQQTKPPPAPTLRRRSSNESASSAMTEATPGLQKQRMTDAVIRIGIKHNVEDIVFMLLTLKRKERSLCLFNQDFLREQIKLAKSALEIFKDDDDDDDGSTGNASPPTPIVGQPPLPITITAPPPPLPATTTTTLRISRAIPIVAPSPAQPMSSTNLDKLARLAPNTIDKFLASIEGLPLTQQKEKLGDQLFPHVKATGVRHAPKITVRLLDTIPLDELARTMHDKVALKTRVDAAVASLQQ